MSPCPFVWYELMTTDLEAAEGFYAHVVGWTTADAGMPGMRYTIASAGGAGVGGMMALPPESVAAGARPGWLGYVGVDDVDRVASQAAQAGGAIQRPGADIPGVGRFAVVADPHGAVFALFKGNSPEAPPAAPPGTPGQVGWHELQAGELEPAFAFYSGLFGWTRDQAIDMGPMGAYQLFAAGAGPIGGMMKRVPEVPMPFWLYYFNVGGIDAAVERAKSRAGQIVHGPVEVPGGAWIAQCLDPQGAMFALVGPKG